MIKWITGLFDKVLDAIYSMLELVLMILPNSPIQGTAITVVDGPFMDVMGHINYFVPVGTMLKILTTYLIAVGIWYVTRWILRLGQFIQ